ncbi:hypothetical protein P153DRAFT_370097 [Dothidotthia symphoricarpi CBS 119687]|uniref:Myb-like domain-containing protein n=1 Tax=Dothidotthia symphoricarpi CBS 119687 TaxID=1392245 RepID=A0A6A6A1N2_9PLEO|nr:uncharacterized protein P153DRAFT_370097 [Dothidotthia symphoricarpi CBS 119687]KAF2125436.1 hypothetical protein P153DRAFT_370097 [Dothidotthia symphoricarpi CBS 119687]
MSEVRHRLNASSSPTRIKISATNEVKPVAVEDFGHTRNTKRSIRQTWRELIEKNTAQNKNTAEANTASNWHLGDPSSQFSTLDNSSGTKFRDDDYNTFDSLKPTQEALPPTKVAKASKRSSIPTTAEILQPQSPKVSTSEEIRASIRNGQRKKVARSPSTIIELDESGSIISTNTDLPGTTATAANFDDDNDILPLYPDGESSVYEYSNFDEVDTYPELKNRDDQPVWSFVDPKHFDPRDDDVASDVINSGSKGGSDLDLRMMEEYQHGKIHVCDVTLGCGGSCLNCAGQDSYATATAQGDHEPENSTDDGVALAFACPSSNDKNSVIDDPDAQDDAADTASALRLAFETLGLEEYSSVEQEFLDGQLTALLNHTPGLNVALVDSYTTIRKHQEKTGIWETVFIEEGQSETLSEFNPQDACADAESPLKKAFITLDLQAYSSVDFEILRDAVMECMLDTPERADDAAKAFTVIVEHQDVSGCWDLIKNWNEEMDQTLMNRKTENPEISWAKIGEELGMPGTVCKQRFSDIKPEDWKPNTKTTPAKKSADQEVEAQIKSAKAVLESDPSCGWTVPTPEPEVSMWRAGAPNSGDEWDSWDNNNHALDSGVQDLLDCVPQEFNSKNNKTENFKRYPWSVTANQKQEEAMTYTVTYHAILKSGDQELRIPIDSKHVSGPEKDIADNNMKKVLKWVHDKGLDERISLQDAFDLAKDMQGEGGEKEEKKDIVNDKHVSSNMAEETVYQCDLCWGCGELKQVCIC